MKNFSNTKVVLVTTIPAQKSKPEWLLVRFCSRAKMSAGGKVLAGWSEAEIGWLFPWQKGRGFQFVVFLPTNWNLLFRQTFWVSRVWLKTVRGQNLKSWKQRVFIFYPGEQKNGAALQNKIDAGLREQQDRCNHQGLRPDKESTWRIRLTIIFMCSNIHIFTTWNKKNHT